jgi:hypothetical protein
MNISVPSVMPKPDYNLATKCGFAKLRADSQMPMLSALSESDFVSISVQMSGD